MSHAPLTKELILERLQLEPHVEGGYFRRSYASETHCESEAGPRRLLTSIYYLLTDDRPIGHLHRNRSDIVHYWHAGSALEYTLLSPAGELRRLTLGPDLAAGHQLQLCVPGNVWKASRLREGEFGLISEAVSPGFDYVDMELATGEAMRREFPGLWPQLRELVRSESSTS